ncbi:MAG: hypothetical protein H0V74_03995 [Chloroflexi bacterium]|nr:hypothetical protein [Chloroflexota bacterium]
MGLLLEDHDLGRALGSASAPQILIGMWMDSRKAARLRGLYPRITVAPLLYRVEDDLLYQPDQAGEFGA